MSNSSSGAATKQLFEEAVAEFWRVFTESFPEVETGDSQLTGEDVGAMAIWRNGDAGEHEDVVSAPLFLYPVPDGLDESRVSAMVEQGMKAAAKTLFAGHADPAPAAPEEVVSLLTGCVHEVLHWNWPADAPEADDDGGAGMSPR